MSKLVPNLSVRVRDSSGVGNDTIEYDYLSFVPLTNFECRTETEAREALHAHLDDLINQLIIMRACV